MPQVEDFGMPPTPSLPELGVLVTEVMADFRTFCIQEVSYSVSVVQPIMGSVAIFRWGDVVAGTLIDTPEVSAITLGRSSYKLPSRVRNLCTFLGEAAEKKSASLVLAWG
jgi:hypothetical protein